MINQVILFAATMMVFGNIEGQNQIPENETITGNTIYAPTPKGNNDAKVIQKIKEFYSNYVFGNKPLTGPIVNRYCTKKLAKKLADDYEYEGGGYAVWDFASGSQDPDETKVLKVVPLGNGKYKVVMDANVTVVLSVVASGGKILFDDVKR